MAKTFLTPKGDQVLLKFKYLKIILFSSLSPQRKNVALEEGRVVDIDHTAHNYQIEFKDPDTLKCKTA